MEQVQISLYTLTFFPVDFFLSLAVRICIVTCVCNCDMNLHVQIFKSLQLGIPFVLIDDWYDSASKVHSYMIAGVGDLWKLIPPSRLTKSM